MCWNVVNACLAYFQAYKTISSDTERHDSKLARMGSTAKGQFEGAHTNTHTHTTLRMDSSAQTGHNMSAFPKFLTCPFRASQFHSGRRTSGILILRFSSVTKLIVNGNKLKKKVPHCTSSLTKANGLKHGGMIGLNACLFRCLSADDLSIQAV